MVRALEELPGVKNAYACFPEKRAVIVYEQASVTIEQMRQALLKAGYVASPKTNNCRLQANDQDESSDRIAQQNDDLICYCFEYIKDDIERDYIKNGRSLIMEKIAMEKKTGGCDCANKNPKGR